MMRKTHPKVCKVSTARPALNACASFDRCTFRVASLVRKCRSHAVERICLAAIRPSVRSFREIAPSDKRDIEATTDCAREGGRTGGREGGRGIRAISAQLRAAE